MLPSAKELAEGQKASERLEAFQRYGRRGPFELSFFFILIATGGIWHAFERDGWKPALITGLVWIGLIAISVCQLVRQRKQADKASAYLLGLKDRYGADVYSEIQKYPHSLYYYFCLKRFPPFSRQTVKFP